MLDYDFICKVEEANLYKRFLPYSIGSPARHKTHDDFYDRANFVFFSDSHIDFMNADASLDNLKRTIAFSNESPIGNALLGKKAGETVSVKVPTGTITITVKKIG